MPNNFILTKPCVIVLRTALLHHTLPLSDLWSTLRVMWPVPRNLLFHLPKARRQMRQLKCVREMPKDLEEKCKVQLSNFPFVSLHTQLSCIWPLSQRTILQLFTSTKTRIKEPKSDADDADDADGGRKTLFKCLLNDLGCRSWYGVCIVLQLSDLREVSHE